jgi:DNA-binding response OmpR family regulator
VIEEKENENGCGDMLDREGLRVLRATGRSEGLRVAREQHPDLLVIVLGTSEREGKELAMEVKLLPELARVPVIAVGARAERTEAAERTREIFDGYVTEPIAREEFRKVVRKLLGRRVTREVKARRDRPLRMKS